MEPLSICSETEATSHDKFTTKIKQILQDSQQFECENRINGLLSITIPTLFLCSGSPVVFIMNTSVYP